MRAAPAFELQITPTRGERLALALLGSLCACVVTTWLWSHVDAAVGPAGRGALPWVGAGVGGALLGGLCGWLLAPREAATLSCCQHGWMLGRPGAQPLPCSVRVRLDLGAWLLLRVRPASGGRVSWLGVGRGQAGEAWHALRATLFAPGAGAEQPGPDEGAQA